MSPHLSKSTYPKTLDIIRTLFAKSLPAGIDDASLLSVNLEDFVMDSLDKFDLILRLEKSYSIFLDEVKIAECRTINDLVDLVELSQNASTRA